MLGCISCKRKYMCGLFSYAVYLVRQACEMLVSVNALTSASTKEFVSQDFLECEKKFFSLRFSYLIRFFCECALQ